MGIYFLSATRHHILLMHFPVCVFMYIHELWRKRVTERERETTDQSETWSETWRAFLISFARLIILSTLLLGVTS